MPKSTFTPAYGLMLQALLDLRLKSEVTQVELAKRLGRTQVFVSNFERGLRRIDLIEFYAIVRALGGDPVVLFADLVRRLPKKVAI
jgi:transcriptional regulator with XRE-family HTH domain